MRITRWALSVSRDKFIVRWAIAWACLAGALGLHVADEALTGFLPFFVSLRDTYAWVPFPTFTFPVWLGGLITLVIILFALTPLVLRGHRWLRGLSYFLGGIMILNAVGHFLMAVWLGEFAPGVYSSPILLVAAIALLVTTIQSRQADPGIRQ
jgi:hypothetical protein